MFWNGGLVMLCIEPDRAGQCIKLNVFSDVIYGDLQNCMASKIEGDFRFLRF